MTLLDAIQRFYLLAAGIVAILGLLARIAYRLGQFLGRIERFIKDNDDDHRRYDAHLQARHARW